MTIRAIVAIALTVLAIAASAKAEGFLPESTPPTNSADDRLLILNGDTSHIVYDDGQDDLFCVTRKVVVGYNGWGFRIRKQTMHCR
jgi:hypothetical protein